MTVRRALLVGINAYAGSPLRGCINDVMQMKDLLKHYYGFTEDNFKLILDKEASLQGIKAGLEWLAQGGDMADAVRVFHYSGHGSYLADTNGDEPDGRDECLVPYDYQTAGMLVDDTLKVLYDTFPKPGNLTLVMDSCHSGSVQKGLGDVVYRFIPMTKQETKRADEAKQKFEADREAFIIKDLKQVDTSKLSDEELRKLVSGLITTFAKRRFGDIRVRDANVLVAGCRSDQQSADAHLAGEYHGAFTYFLAESITQSNGNLTYRELAEAVGKKLSDAHFVQVPQLEYKSGRDNQPAFKPFL